MKLVLNGIRLNLNDDINTLKSICAKKLGLSVKELENFKVVKESIDARKKPHISLVYSVMVELQDNKRIPNDKNIKLIKENVNSEGVLPGNIKLNHRPIIIGSGPAGMFAGLILSEMGYKPLIFERGECMEKRSGIVRRYWDKGELDIETNVQFGEGGAGTFSDGKLTTRINDRRCERVLKEFFISGANEEILYKAKPHIGSDILKEVVVNMRKRIINNGGEVRFNSRLTSLKIKGNRVIGAVINGNEEIAADVVILAIGHSARDTYAQLLKGGVKFTQKPFSIGVRIEHLREIINKAQFGEAAGHPKLKAADYQLFYKTNNRTVYSFCMCPGGIVVASASESGMIVTNGMSEFARGRENSNSALVVSVGSGDFGSSHPLAGVEFQRRWERMAYKAGGNDGSAPIQTLGDFLGGVHSGSIGIVKPSYTGSVNISDINLCLPSFVAKSLKESIGYFDKKIKKFGMKDALLTGIETRTSSPVRIPRGDTLEAEGIGGLYPAGEGAGYAGGIMSAAVDGIRIAEQIIKTYAQSV